jgi:hypothetical protein
VSHGDPSPHGPAEAPPPDGSNLSGRQLIAIMGGTLLAALVFLYFISG